MSSSAGHVESLFQVHTFKRLVSRRSLTACVEKLVIRVKAMGLHPSSIKTFQNMSISVFMIPSKKVTEVLRNEVPSLRNDDGETG